MSTGNFGSDDFLGIIAINDRDYEFDDYDWENWEDDIKDFNDDLQYFKLRIEPGYYEGGQLMLDGNDFWNVWGNTLDVLELKNDKEKLTEYCKEHNARYYDISPKAIFNEYKKIIEWINKGIKEEWLLNLGIAYRFSNGETGYSRSKQMLKA